MPWQALLNANARRISHLASESEEAGPANCHGLEDRFLHELWPEHGGLISFFYFYSKPNIYNIEIQANHYFLICCHDFDSEWMRVYAES